MLGLEFPHQNWLQRTLTKVAATPPGRWLFSGLMHHIDNATRRLSGGKQTTSQLLTNLPVVSLTATGAKSGQPRTVPLVAIPDGDGLLLIASNWGRPPLPAWYHNLKANPQATVAANGLSEQVVARELGEGERAQAWNSAVALYPGYEMYARRLEGIRAIPILRLEPAT